MKENRGLKILLGCLGCVIVGLVVVIIWSIAFCDSKKTGEIIDDSLNGAISEIVEYGDFESAVQLIYDQADGYVLDGDCETGLKMLKNIDITQYSDEQKMDFYSHMMNIAYECDAAEDYQIYTNLYMQLSEEMPDALGF